MFKDYLVQNWPLILVLLAFSISLITTVFLDKKTIRRIFILIAAIFALSISVFIEFYIANMPKYKDVRVVLIAVRYSATPFIIAQVMYILVKRIHWLLFVPAAVLLIVNFISIFTGIVFSVDASNEFHRGPLGFSPFIIV